MSGKTAKAQRNQAPADNSADLPRLSDQEITDFKTAWDAQQKKHADWEEKERLVINLTGDLVSAKFNSKVTDGRLSTIVIERSARVMAQLATGVVRALTKKNKGLAQLMSLFLTRYIQPNDNAQFDHLTKLRMIDMYSQVYGVIPVLYDLSVTEKYLGPSSFILPIRSWYPQAQKLSVDDSDHNHVETTVSAGWLKDQKGKGSWNNSVIDHILAELKDSEGTTPASNGSQQQTATQKARESNPSGGKGDAAQIRLATRYENGSEGRWKTFFPEFDNLIGRDCQSKDGNIPIVLKHHIPLLDSIYGLGAFERGKTIQYAMDSLVAMYMAGVQMSIFPPRIVQKSGVVLSSLDYAPGATWIETVKDSIRNYTVSPDGLQTFQSTYGWLTGSLLNQNGSTDTSQTVKSTADPSAGRTPEALKQQAARESAADAWDRSMMEQFQQILYERQLNIAALTPKPFTFHIFDDEINQIKESGLKDVMDVFESEKEAKITLTKDKIQLGTFKFIIDASSNALADQETEHQAMSELLDKFVAAPQLVQVAQMDGEEVHLGQIIRQYIMTAGTKDPEKLISKIEQAQPAAAPAQGALPDGAAAPMQLGAGAGAPTDPAQMQQILSGQPPAPAAAPPPPPDPSKDPDHQLILALLDKMPASALRKVISSVGLPSDGLLPVEAKMAAEIVQPEDPTGANSRQFIEVDASSPYQAAKDPHAALAQSQDPAVQNLYKHIQSANPGAPIEATEPNEPAMAGATA